MSSWLTPSEFAAQMQVNKVTVRRWIHAGLLPAFRRGGRTLLIEAGAAAAFKQAYLTTVPVVPQTLQRQKRAS